MAIKVTNQKCFIILAAAATTIIILVTLVNKSKYGQLVIFETLSSTLPQTQTIKKTPQNWRGLTKGEINKLSVLGRILYLEEEPPEPHEPSKKYQILVWKYGKAIENRHLKNFGKQLIDPFEGCSVNNCELTYADEALKTADIVIFHMHRMKRGDLPKRNRSYDQIWAFLTDESPYHIFMSKNNLSDYNGVFNWSMTYRMDSDIPVPYGRTILKNNNPNENLTISKRKDILIAILGSNCGGSNKRYAYVKELKNYIPIDMYGGCGTLKTCPGHFKANCRDIDDYLFYLAFENSNCDEYITEKLWWNAYEKNSIPIVMGASKDSYKKLVPPNSYINVDDFVKPKDLATYIISLNSTGQFRDYFSWKDNYQVLNEHGYFQSKSYHYCRVCEALNYNERNKKVYENITQFWNRNRDCHPAWNA